MLRQTLLWLSERPGVFTLPKENRAGLGRAGHTIRAHVPFGAVPYPYPMRVAFIGGSVVREFVARR